MKRERTRLTTVFNPDRTNTFVRIEASNWLKQAKEDLITAEVMNANDRFYACAFFCQQAAEKALKALYLEKKRENVATHNLIYLAEKLDAPIGVQNACKELNPDYTVPRYPDAANGIPADNYNDEIAERRLDKAKKVMTWVDSTIG